MLSLLLAAAMQASAAPPPAALEIRFCPADAIHSHPLAPLRQVDSLFVQNVAVINRGETPVTIGAIEIALLREGAVSDTRHIEGNSLATAASRGQAIHAGMNAVVPGQFCDGALLGGADVAASPALAPGEALLVTWQVFAYTGPREALRVRVRAAGELDVWAASADLPVVGMSTHSYRFPVEGVWFIGAGASLHSHHRWMIAEEFGLDILQIGGDGATHRGDGSAFSDYLAYGAEVRAAAAGEVVAAVDGIAEDLGAMQRAGESDEDYNRRLVADQARRLSGGDDGIIGNHVVIRHQGDEYSVYAHLQPGSVRVRVGQELAAGEVLGLLGSSGNSTEPHLHFQLCDGPRPLHCAGIPVAFEGFDAPPQTGDIVGGE